MFRSVTFRTFGILKLRLLHMMSYLFRIEPGLTVSFSGWLGFGSSESQFGEVSLKCAANFLKGR